MARGKYKAKREQRTEADEAYNAWQDAHPAYGLSDPEGWSEKRQADIEARRADVQARRENLANKERVYQYNRDGFSGIDPNVTQSQIEDVAKEVGLNSRQRVLLNEHLYAQRQYETASNGNSQYSALKSQYEEKFNHVNSLQNSMLGAMTPDSDVKTVHNLSDQLGNARKEAEAIKQKLADATKGKEMFENATNRLNETRSALNDAVDQSSLGNLYSKVRDLKANEPIKEAAKERGKTAIQEIEGKGKKVISEDMEHMGGKIGKFAVGALMMYGMVQALNSNRGKQDNSTLYNPGGTM